MTSKRKGRDWQHQKDRKRWAIRLRNDDPHPCARCGAVDYHGYEWDLGHPEGADLARVADAAREQGRREGYRKALADIAADVALLRDMDHQPQPETTPEDANACGCDCACASIPKPWTPGNVRP